MANSPCSARYCGRSLNFYHFLCNITALMIAPVISCACIYSKEPISVCHCYHSTKLYVQDTTTCQVLPSLLTVLSSLILPSQIQLHQFWILCCFLDRPARLWCQRPCSAYRTIFIMSGHAYDWKGVPWTLSTGLCINICPLLYLFFWMLVILKYTWVCYIFSQYKEKIF